MSKNCQDTTMGNQQLSHYLRSAVGDVMFKVVKGHPWLEVNEKGEGRNSKTKKLYNLCIDRDGYTKFSTTYGGVRVYVTCHRAVALTFIPNPEGKPIVNHKDSLRANNHVGNLEWSTPEDNTFHGVIQGKIVEGAPRGEVNGFNKYPTSLITLICEDLQDGLRNTDISRKHKVDIKLPSDIRCKKTWTHISKNFNIPPARKSRGFSEKTVEWICGKLQDGYTTEHIKVKTTNHNITEDFIDRIRNRELFHNVTKKYLW